jgi:V/A-type H+-transporting ATPase subunit I
MRVDVRKCLFFGYEKARKSFFAKAQELGIVHFIDPDKQSRKEVPLQLQQVLQAIRVLRSLPVVEQEEEVDSTRSDEIVKEVIDTKDALDRLLESERLLRLEIERVDVFGDFSPEEMDYIRKEAHRYVQFFQGKRGIASDKENFPEELLYVGSKHGVDYFFSISEKPIFFEGLTEMKVEHPASSVKKNLDVVREKIEQTEKKLKALAKYNAFLHRILGVKMDRYHLEEAESFSKEPVKGALFAVEGWVPKNKRDSLNKLVDDLDVDYAEIAPEEGEELPTYLENKGLARLGEDLVHIYDTPSSSDKDPSLWVLLFFTLFFAIIIADAGYGLVFLATALYFRWKTQKPSKPLKRVLNLATILCSACVIWGFTTSSFFGLEIPPDHFLQKFSFIKFLGEKKAAFHIHAKDSVYQQWVERYPATAGKQARELLEYAHVERGNTSYPIFEQVKEAVLLEVALFIGCLHVILSFIRNFYRSWIGIGWIIAIIGGYFYFSYYLKADSMFAYLFGLQKVITEENAYILLVGGVGIAVFLSVIYNRLMGLFEVMTSVQIFSDILSYLRLYALGLAGGIVASTVNQMASSTYIVFGLIIFLMGHAMNMALAIMGGVIHGLRLNFLEWYHYSFEGGGKLFVPLQKLYSNEE